METRESRNKMRKGTKWTIAIVIIVIIIAGVGILGWMHSNSQKDNTQISSARTESSSSIESSSSSVSSLSKSLESKNPAANSPENKVSKSSQSVNGDVITPSQIADARGELKDAGINSNAYSDQDIKGIIKGANAAHMSVPQYANSKLK